MTVNQPTTDLAIIGGGVIGLSCALQLRARFPNMKMTIFDAPNKPGVASRAAAGMLVPLAEFHEDSPLFRFAMASYRSWPRFLEEFTESGPVLDTNGALIPAGEEEADRGERAAAFARLHTDQVTELVGAEVRAAEPLLEGPACQRAFHIEGSLIDPRKLHDALTHRAGKSGISIVSGNVCSIDLRNGLAESLTLENGNRVGFGNLLLSTGAWSRSLGEMLGLRVEIVPIKGQVVRLEAPDGLLRHVVHTTPIYFAPRTGQGLLIGATMEEKGFDESVEDSVTEKLRERARQFSSKIAELPVAEAWMGFRPKFSDGAPAIGWSSRIDNLLIATGHFRNGILLTPETGRLIADCFASKSNARTSFDPGRLGL